MSDVLGTLSAVLGTTCFYWQGIALFEMRVNALSAVSFPILKKDFLFFIFIWAKKKTS